MGVDRHSKMRHCVTFHMTIDASGLYLLYVKEVVCLHSLPATIVSDQDPQFASMYWGLLWSHLVIERKMSTAFHPPTDGLIPQMDTCMERDVRVFFNHQQDDCVIWLPMAEVASNNGASETMMCTPFFAIQGTDPQMTFAGEPMEGSDGQCVNADHV